MMLSKSYQGFNVNLFLPALPRYMKNFAMKVNDSADQDRGNANAIRFAE